MSNSHLSNLNKEQSEAVTHKDGPLMILAGAGAGKTRTITYRIIHLIKNGVSPENILAVTFTNKAAKEMRERVLKLIDEDGEINRPISARASGMPSPYVSTFHSLCVRIIRENHNALNLTRQFTIFDRTDSVRAIKNSIKELGIDPKQYEAKNVLSFISRKKGDAITNKDFSLGSQTNPRHHTISRIWDLYESKLKKESALDFDDLLLKTLLLLRKNKSILEKYWERWKYIHIDEYQDTNKVQFEIAKLLSGKNGNICVVGDIDQNVYSWRGADIANLMSFEDEFPGTKSVVLEQNYRSTQTILSAANDIIEKNVNRKEKKLFTKNNEGEKISVFGGNDEREEAKFIIEETKKIIEAGTEAKEIAVLYRANFQSRILEEAFLYSGIPYQVLGTKFFDRREIKDLLSYLRASTNKNSWGDISRIISVPPRGIGKQTLAKMIEGKTNELTPAAQKKVSDFYKILEKIKKSAESEKPSDTIRTIIFESGLETKYKNGNEEEKERYANMQELVTLATKYDSMEPIEGVEKLLEDAALATDQDELDDEKKTNSVKLMTVHASKGLEFDYVFITGLEEGLFPSERMGNEEKDEEEERRLFYVALTRARKKVYLTHAMLRTIYGNQQINTNSQFIDDINDDRLEVAGEIKLPHKRKISLLDDIEF